MQKDKALFYFSNSSLSTTQALTRRTAAGSRYLAIASGFILFYFIIERFLDIPPTVSHTMPIPHTIILALGIHPAWFGVLFANVAEIDMIMEDLNIHIGNSFRIK